MPNLPSRRLKVILHADVINSTFLVQIDEAIAHERIQDAFHRFSQTIHAYGGITQELRGDALLAEFARASDAISAAMLFQYENADFNNALTGKIQVQMRVGLSLSEVIIADNTLTGAGVVLAQRLEQLATANCVVVQGAVREATPTRFPFNYKSLGEQSLKGFDLPIQAYLVSLKSGQSVPSPESAPKADFLKPATSSEIELPDKPSIAVLPFVNLSNDPEQEYFANGISEDITTGLGRIQQLFVIAQNSTLSYKGRAPDVQTVARELGVRYVLEGSVRKAGNRMRISVQLVEAATRGQLWADRYDRDLVDIFDVQDEITENVVGAIEPELTRAEWKRSLTIKPENLSAWNYVTRAVALMKEFSDQTSLEAMNLLQHAITLDPTYARSYGHRGWLVIWRAFQGWGEMEVALETANTDFSRGIQLDANEPWSYMARAFIGLATRDSELTISSVRKAIELNPSFAYAHSTYGGALACAGQGMEGLENVTLAMRLSPRDIWHEEFDLDFALCHFQAENYVESAKFSERASLPRPGHVTPHVLLIASYGHLGQAEKVNRALVRMQINVPEYSFSKENAFHIYVLEKDHKRLLDGLDKAGVLEV